MNSNQRNRSYLPRVNEEKTVIDDAHRDGRRGTLIGGVTGAGIGSYLGKKKKLIGAGVGALVGSAAGGKIGHMVGVNRGSKDVRDARKALRQMARLNEKLTELETNYFDKFGNANEGPLSGQNPSRVYPKAKGPFEPGNGIDDQGRYEMTRERQRLASIYGWGIVSALDDSELTEEHCEALRAALMARADKANGYGPSEAQFERHYLFSKLGQPVVAAMGNAEVHAIYLSHKRRGLVELDDDQETTDLGLDMRNRNGQGEFQPGGSPSPDAVRRAYAPHDDQRHTGRNIAAAGAGVAGLGAAILARKKFRNSKLPGLTTSGKVIDATASPVKSFARRNMPVLRGPGMPKCLIRRPRRGGKLLPKTNLALLIHDPDFPIVPMKQPKLPNGTYQPVPEAKTKAEVIARLRKLTEWSRRHNLGAGGLAAGLVDGAIDAVGLGGATNRKKKKLVLDKDGNPINPQWLPDPGTTTTSSFSIGSIAGKFGPDAAVIAGADLTAEELHDAIQTAKKKKKQKALVNGGVEQESGVPGNGPSTLSAIHGTLLEFEHGNERLDKARRDGVTVGAAGVGAVAGALGGLKYEAGSPIRPGQIQPGMRVSKRFGPGGLLSHVGVVDENGRVVHRTRGSSKLRSVKPESFNKIGKGPLRHESYADDLPPHEAASNATRAAGTRAGRYSACQGNNCQDATERLISKSKPVSRQVRRAIVGAAAAALTAGAAARILGHRHQDNQ